jgi:hemolysin type calcium-binding protein
MAASGYGRTVVRDATPIAVAALRLGLVWLILASCVLTQAASAQTATTPEPVPIEASQGKLEKPGLRLPNLDLGLGGDRVLMRVGGELATPCADPVLELRLFPNPALFPGVCGELGDDHVIGGDGADALDGGLGRDGCDGGPGEPDGAVNCESLDAIRSPAEGAGQCDRPTIEGGPDASVIEGTEESDVILGSEQSESINGLGADDTICAGAGDDLVLGGGGNDRLFGGEGQDELHGLAGDDLVDAGPDDDSSGIVAPAPVASMPDQARLPFTGLDLLTLLLLVASLLALAFGLAAFARIRGRIRRRRDVSGS